MGERCKRKVHDRMAGDVEKRTNGSAEVCEMEECETTIGSQKPSFTLSKSLSKTLSFFAHQTPLRDENA